MTRTWRAGATAPSGSATAACPRTTGRRTGPRSRAASPTPPGGPPDARPATTRTRGTTDEGPGPHHLDPDLAADPRRRPHRAAGHLPVRRRGRHQHRAPADLR